LRSPGYATRVDTGTHCARRRYGKELKKLSHGEDNRVTKRSIGVRIVGHKLAGMPHIVEMKAAQNGKRADAHALDTSLAMGVAICLSSVLWAALIALVA